MNKKLTFTALALIAGAFCVKADINITLPADSDVKQIKYYYAPISKYATASSRAEAGMVVDSITPSGNKALIKTPATDENLVYGLMFEGTNGISLYLAPGDVVNVNVASFYPFSYSLSDSPMADSMNELLILEAPFYAKMAELNADREKYAEEIKKLGIEYEALQKDFIANDPNSPAAPLALMNLSGEDFMTLYEALLPEMKSNMLFPFLEKQYIAQQKTMEAEQKQKALESGSTDAPNFTLKDLEGKDVSLTDFRGKWVILDFWGSWCPWCIKGFPELKEAYAKYKDRLEIIGIDCNETEDAWRAGVEKYELPWVQVYNPAGGSVTADYGVRGYPTKAIIDPEGKVKNITVGHDPAFFTVLTELLGE